MEANKNKKDVHIRIYFEFDDEDDLNVIVTFRYYGGFVWYEDFKNDNGRYYIKIKRGQYVRSFAELKVIFQQLDFMTAWLKQVRLNPENGRAWVVDVEREQFRRAGDNEELVKHFMQLCERIHEENADEPD